jgi:hypothetical protein
LAVGPSSNPGEDVFGDPADSTHTDLHGLRELPLPLHLIDEHDLDRKIETTNVPGVKGLPADVMFSR